MIKRRRLREKARPRSEVDIHAEVEGMLKPLLNGNIHLTVPWFLMLSYLYYHESVSLVSDAFYDKICAVMLARWSRIKHQHKRLITKDMLQAGTGYDLRKEDYPTITKSCALRLASEHWPRARGQG